MIHSRRNCATPVQTRTCSPAEQESDVRVRRPEVDRQTDQNVSDSVSCHSVCRSGGIAISRAADQPASGRGWEGEDYGAKNYSFLHPTTNWSQTAGSGQGKGLLAETECRQHMYLVASIFILKTHFKIKQRSGEGRGPGDLPRSFSPPRPHCSQ